MFSQYTISVSEELLIIAKDKYQLYPFGIHAFKHWERVYQNGMYLCDHENADQRVVALFAFFHDSCRENESIDPEHGERAAAFLKTIPLDILDIETHQLELLCKACEGHNKGFISDDVTIGVCWDADRLDLYRVGIYPDKNYLSTETAKNDELIQFCPSRFNNF